MEETTLGAGLPCLCRRNAFSVRWMGVARCLPCSIHRADAKVLEQEEETADGQHPAPSETGPGQLHQEFRLSPKGGQQHLEDQCREGLGRRGNDRD